MKPWLSATVAFLTLLGVTVGPDKSFALEAAALTNVFVRKLELFGSLSKDDKRLLEEVVSSFRILPAHTEIIREGEEPDSVHLVLSGLACRYKFLEEGRRQILAFLAPGDFCDLHVFILKAMDHTVATLSPCAIVEIPRQRVLKILESPAISRALWWVTLVDEAVLREWVVNIGARTAKARIAHLFCELHLRLKSIGLAKDEGFELPITQIDLGDTMGISSIHVSRSLRELRQQKLVTLRGRNVIILDVYRLREMCGFNPNYLHLSGGKRDKLEPFEGRVLATGGLC